MSRGGRRIGAGRPLGSASTRTKASLNVAIEETGLEPEKALCLMALNQMPCNRCDDDCKVTNELFLALAPTVLPPDRERAVTDPDGLRTCPCCGGSNFIVVGVADRIKALSRILDSRQPKLAALRMENKPRRVTVVSMNSCSQAVREQVSKIIDEAGAKPG